MKLEQQEKKIIVDIKKSAKAGQMVLKKKTSKIGHWRDNVLAFASSRR